MFDTEYPLQRLEWKTLGILSKRKMRPHCLKGDKGCDCGFGQIGPEQMGRDVCWTRGYKWERQRACQAFEKLEDLFDVAIRARSPGLGIHRERSPARARLPIKASLFKLRRDPWTMEHAFTASLE
jgi:hypothetical protein